MDTQTPAPPPTHRPRSCPLSLPAGPLSQMRLCCFRIFSICSAAGWPQLLCSPPKKSDVANMMASSAFRPIGISRWLSAFFFWFLLPEDGTAPKLRATRADPYLVAGGSKNSRNRNRAPFEGLFTEWEGGRGQDLSYFWDRMGFS